MWKVGLPHDVVDADLVPQFDAFRFEPEVHEHLATHGLARTRGNALCPKMAALPLVIARGQHIVESSDSGLGEHDLEARKALRNAGKN